VTQGALLFIAGNRWLVSGFRLEFTLAINWLQASSEVYRNLLAAAQVSGHIG
jgi:hypothetical protein